jgi:hypothetical protein
MLVRVPKLGPDHPGYSIDLDRLGSGGQEHFLRHGLKQFIGDAGAGKSRDESLKPCDVAAERIYEWESIGRGERRLPIDVETANAVRVFLASRGKKAKEYASVVDANTASAAFAAYVTAAMVVKLGAMPEPAAVNLAVETNWGLLIQPAIEARLAARDAVKGELTL